MSLVPSSSSSSSSSYLVTAPQTTELEPFEKGSVAVLFNHKGFSGGRKEPDGMTECVKKCIDMELPYETRDWVEHTPISYPLNERGSLRGYTNNATKSHGQACWLTSALQSLACFTAVGTYAHIIHHAHYSYDMRFMQATNPFSVDGCTGRAADAIEYLLTNTTTKAYTTENAPHNKLVIGYLSLRMIGALRYKIDTDQAQLLKDKVFVSLTSYWKDSRTWRDGSEAIGKILVCIKECMRLIPCGEAITHSFANNNLESVVIKKSGNVHPDNNSEEVGITFSLVAARAPIVMDLQAYINHFYFHDIQDENQIRLPTQFPDILCFNIQQTRKPIDKTTGYNEFSPTMAFLYDARKLTVGPSTSGKFAHYRLVSRILGTEEHIIAHVSVLDASGKREWFIVDDADVQRHQHLPGTGFNDINKGSWISNNMDERIENLVSKPPNPPNGNFNIHDLINLYNLAAREFRYSLVSVVKNQIDFASRTLLWERFDPDLVK